ncbi:UNVERIFIED_ORG: hypothetical protein EDC93_1011120 [Bacillus cereus]
MGVKASKSILTRMLFVLSFNSKNAKTYNKKMIYNENKSLKSIYLGKQMWYNKYRKNERGETNWQS